MIYLRLQPDENIQQSANSRVPYSVTAIRWLQNFDLLHDFITHAYIPDNYVIQVLNIDDCGQKLYITYKYVVQIQVFWGKQPRTLKFRNPKQTMANSR